jgi:hypothetical protein
MRRSPTDLAGAAALSLKLERVQTELNSQRAMFESIILILDNHTWQLDHYRAISALYGIKH